MIANLKVLGKFKKEALFMFAQRFLGIKKARKNAQEQRNNPLERNKWVMKGGNKSGSTPLEIIVECREGRVVRK